MLEILICEMMWGIPHTAAKQQTLTATPLWQCQ